MRTIGISESSPKRISAEEKRYLRIQADFEEQLVALAVGLSSFEKTRKDGIVIAARTTAHSDDVMAVARRDKRFCDALEKYLSYSVYSSLVIGALITGALMAKNHGINVLEFIPGYKAPEKTETQPVNEISEDQRAMLMMALIQRQADLKNRALDESTVA